MSLISDTHSLFRAKKDRPERYTAHTPDGWDIALYRYRPETEVRGRTPVFLCHGLGANRYNLDAPGRLSFALWLRSFGYDVWIVELRGAGESSKPKLRNKLRYDWTFDDYVQKDVPAALALVARETGVDQVHWVGHSMGGMVAYAYAIEQSRRGQSSHLRTLTAVGSPSFARAEYGFLKQLVKLRFLLDVLPRIPYGGPAYLLAPIMPLVKVTAGRIFANPRNMSTVDLMKLVALVPQDLPSTLIKQFADWIAERGFTGGAGTYAGELHRITEPALIVAGPVDVITPLRDLQHVFDEISSRDKRFFAAGRSTGCAHDYGHIDPILSWRAKEEVWPHIRTWIETH